MERFPLGRSLCLKNVLEANTLYPGLDTVTLLLSKERRPHPPTYSRHLGGTDQPCKQEVLAQRLTPGVCRECVEEVTAACPPAAVLEGWEGPSCGPSRAGALLPRKGACPRSGWFPPRTWQETGNLQLWLPAC